jgi:hypothetical protein
MIEMSYKVKDFKFTTAHFSEQATWLNNSFLGVNKESNTLVFGLGYEKAVFENTRTYANVMHGTTGIKSYSDKVNGLKTAYSYSWTAGVEQDIKNIGTLGLMAYQPASIYNAQANINMPVGLDANYNVIQSTRANLAADVKETRLGLYYKLADRNTNAFGFIETRQNYRGQDGVKDTAVGLRFTGQF